MAVTGIKAMEDHECLWEQDLDAFFRELDDHGGGIVIAVGHVPFMDRVSGLLCDSSLRFSTGGVAAIQLDGPASAAADDHVPGRLLWFVQGPRATQS
jgi:phosphohistidine phosphatase